MRKLKMWGVFALLISGLWLFADAKSGAAVPNGNAVKGAAKTSTAAAKKQTAPNQQAAAAKKQTAPNQQAMQNQQADDDILAITSVALSGVGVVLLIALGVLFWRTTNRQEDRSITEELKAIKEAVKDGRNYTATVKKEILDQVKRGPGAQQNSFAMQNPRTPPDFSELENMKATLDAALPLAKDLDGTLRQLQAAVYTKNDQQLIEKCRNCGLDDPDALDEAIKMMGVLTNHELMDHAAVENCVAKGEAYPGLESELNQTKGALANTNNELAKANNALADANSNLDATRNTLHTVTQERDGLAESLQMLCPEEVREVIDQIRQASSDDPECGALICCHVTQLYWYAKKNAEDLSRIKTAFMRFDDGLYELLENQPEKLAVIREALKGFINAEVLGRTNYEMDWPAPGTDVSENEEWYYRENDVGNRISILRSAVIFTDDGAKVESRARVYTEV